MMAGITCRHCGRVMAVPASRCPWCNETVMVICANCKAYTDDQKSHCDACGLPLQVDRREGLAVLAHHPEIARMAQDKERAQLVASAVVVNHLPDFFYDDGRGNRTVLAQLLGTIRGHRVAAAGILFAAYAYLCQKGYCILRFAGEEEGQERIALTRSRAWDGQQCIEGLLAGQADRALTTHDATEQMIRDLMGFRFVTMQAGALSAPKMESLPERSAFAAIDQMARVTVLPDIGSGEACRVTYGLLVAFVETDRQRADLLALETTQVLALYEQYG